MIHTLKNASGAFLVFCDYQHRDLFVAVFDRLAIIETHDLESTPFLRAAACVSCRWCGSTVWAPELCRLHDDGCPGWEWIMSSQALGFGRSFTAATGRDEISDEEWDAAEQLGIGHGGWPGSAIAAVLIRRGNGEEPPEDGGLFD